MPLLLGLERAALLVEFQNAVYPVVAQVVLLCDLPDRVALEAVAEQKFTQIDGHGWHRGTPGGIMSLYGQSA